MSTVLGSAPVSRSSWITQIGSFLASAKLTAKLKKNNARIVCAELVVLDEALLNLWTIHRITSQLIKTQ